MKSVKFLKLLPWFGIICILSVNAEENTSILHNTTNETEELARSVDIPDNVTGVLNTDYNTTEAGFGNDRIETLLNRSNNVTIVVLGKSGSGISSTIRQLLRQEALPKLNENFKVKEYATPLSENTFLKIIDVEGVVDGKTPEHDAKILATLKSYLLNLKEVHGEDPTIFLVVSNFDDNRYIGSQSTFIQTVKRVQVLQTALYERTTQNNIFLMTRFMSETRDIQRRPKNKIKQLRGSIVNFTRFAEPIYIAVGENIPDPDIVNPEDGYAKLPNKELYPKNVLDLMANISRNTGRETFAKLIEQFRDNRGAYPAPIITGFPNTTDAKDINEILTLIQLTSYDIEDTEVNLALRQAFDSISNPLEREQLRHAIPMLQIHLQNTNIRNISQLPHRTLDRVKFFQNLPPSLEAATLTLLRNYIDNFMPEFVQPPLVGSSYDVTTDEAIPSISPFQTGNLIATSLGYLLPSHIICSRITSQSTRDHTWSVDKLDDYVGQRLKNLEFPERETHFNISNFNGKIKAGFNLAPEPGEIPSVSTVREIRKFVFQLNLDKAILSDEFLDASAALNPLNVSDRYSVTEWKQYFSTFGTHVVSLAYVGGRVEGLVVDRGIQNLTSSGRTALQKQVVDFKPIQLINKPTYQFFGGERSADLEHIYEASTENRSAMLTDWAKSVSYHPIALDYELELLPISELLRSENEKLATEIEKSAKLYLGGKLVYTRIKKNFTGKNPRPRTTTTTPSSILPPDKYDVERTREQNMDEMDITLSPVNPAQNWENTTNSRNDDRSSTPTPPVTSRPPGSDQPKSITPSCTEYESLNRHFMPNPGHTEMEIALEAQRRQDVQSNLLLCELEKQKKAAASREEAEKIRRHEARQREIQESARRIEDNRQKLALERQKLEQMYDREREAIWREQEADLQRRELQFQAEMKQQERNRKMTEDMLKAVLAENERRRKEQEAKKAKGCLKKGTLILMADGTETPVELVAVGDMVLDHELQPTRVIGAMEKFLMSDHFYGFNENGPFFFTDTHVLVGPSEDSSGIQLLVNSLSDLISENPLMRYLNVKQFDDNRTNFLFFDRGQASIVARAEEVYQEPVVYAPDSFVYVIEVESPVGTYFANGVVCRHEIPPLERWPNTVNLILSLGAYEEVQRIEEAEYTLKNVDKIRNTLYNLPKDIADAILAFYDGSYASKYDEAVSIPKDNLDSMEMLPKLFVKPLLSSFLVGLYGEAGILVSHMLDNPKFTKSYDELEELRSVILNCVLKAARKLELH